MVESREVKGASGGEGIRSRRIRWGVLAGLVSAHIVLGILLFDPKPFVGGDNAGYMILAESLESGRGYRDLYLPGAPRHAQYPPFYPAVLALARAGGGDLLAFKALSLLFTATSLFFLYLLARGRLGATGALAVVAPFALNPVLLYYSHWVLSEALFVVLTLAGLWAWERSEGSWRWMAAALVASGLAYLTRAAGLPLLAAFLIALAWRRDWRRLAVGGGVAVVVAGGWWLWGRLAVEGPRVYSTNFLLVNPYAPELGYIGPAELLSRVVNNVRLYAVEVLPESLAGAGPGGVSLVALMAGLIVLALAVVGWVREVRRARVLELFTALYVALICAWPQVWTDRRFLLPLLPVLFLYAMAGLSWCFDFARARRPGWALPVLGGLLALLTVPNQVRAVRFNQECSRFYRQGDRLSCYPPPWRAFVEAAHWVRDNTATEAIVINRKPRLFYYFARRQGDVYPFTPEDEEMLGFLNDVGADYVLVAGISATTYRYLVPVIRSVPERFQLATSVGQGSAAAYVLRYVPATPDDGTVPER